MGRPLRNRLRGHLWTLGPRLRHAVSPLPAPEAEPWETTVADPALGPLRLTGLLRREGDEGSDTLLIVVHGLGGSADSWYARRAARAAAAVGIDCLRLNLRGADRQGVDYYHAGLTADLRAALAAPSLAGYERILLLGYSLGGQTSLLWATEADPDPRVGAVAAVCSPLDLEACCGYIDRPSLWAYRRYLLESLLSMYRPITEHWDRVMAEGRDGYGDGDGGGSGESPLSRPVSYQEARRIRTFRDWDGRVVAPRHGFDSASHYYETVSAGPRLPELAMPALVVSSEDDPMVPAASLRPHLAAAKGAPLEAVWSDAGGHVGFPAVVDLPLGTPSLDLGFRSAETGLDPATSSGLEAQVIAWLRSAAGA